MIEFETITRQSALVEGSTFVSPTAQAIVIGNIAKRILNNASFGRVTAVFERSIYLEVNSSWICLADSSLGFGPLVVSVKSIYGRDWINSFSLDRLVKFSSESIRIDYSTIISTKGVSTWEPPKAYNWTRTSILLGLRALENLVESNIPEKGLGRFIFEYPDRSSSSDECLAAEHSIEVLKNWLKQCFEIQMSTKPDKEAIASLIGLGPGLTPSGDDFLVGMLIALHICGEKPVKNNLYVQIESLIDRTGPVSSIHLNAAAHGEGSHSLHQLLNMLLEGNEAHLEPGIDAINKIGHTSGWDALAGATVVLRQFVSTSSSA